MARPYRTRQDELDVFRGLAHPSRRKIVAAALQKPRSFESLRQLLACSDSTVAAHLRILRDARLITASRNGNAVSYQTNIKALRPAQSWMQGLSMTTPAI